MQKVSRSFVLAVTLLVGIRAPLTAQFAFGTPQAAGPEVNQWDSQSGPSLSSDGLTLYYSNNDSSEWNSGGTGDIYVTTRAFVDDPWGPGEPLGSPVNTRAMEAMPSISTDGRELYFSDGMGVGNWRYRPGGLGGPDLWVATREREGDRWGEWREPLNLGPHVNSTNYDSDPCISHDGLSLYFQSSRNGGLGGSGDIWVTRRAALDAPWGEPVNLGAPVNSPSGEGQPEISADGLLLFFLGDNRPGGKGGLDVWVAARASEAEPWGEPVSLDINTGAGEYTPAISKDGSTLFFSATGRQPGYGQWDLWQVPVSAPPLPSFTATPAEGEAPLEVEVDGSPSRTREGHSIIRYEWDFGDGATADGVTAAHTYVEAGRHSIRLTVTDDRALSWSGSRTVTVGCLASDVSPWIAADVGEPLLRGSARVEDTEDAADIILCAGGKSITGKTDSFHFVYQEYSGDTILSARVMNMAGGLSGAQVGVMLRESLDPDARFAATSVWDTSTRRFRLIYRDEPGGVARSKNGPRGVEPPNAWVRIERQGDEFIGWASVDGVTWEEVSRQTIAGFPEELYHGFFALGGEPRVGSPFGALYAQIRPEATSSPQTFRRGDANSDGRADVSDGVFVLNFLFSGVRAPSCARSADTNDNGAVDVSDGVYLLSHLFSGGPPPPGPFSECGMDPTPDELDCDSYPTCEP